MKSYSQYGEDSFILSLFPHGYIGAVLEVGAYEPLALSNSRLFIEAGWSAMLVEPSPAPLRALLEEYGHNPNVSIFSGAMANSTGRKTQRFDISDGPLSTSNPASSKTWGKDDLLIGSLNVPLYGPDFFCLERVDFLSVDTEGNGIDIADAMLACWRNGHLSFIPKVICIEREAGRDAYIDQMAWVNGYEIVPHDPSGGVNRILRLRSWKV
jgi:hypothetical protein